jgi:hypothetical protein
MHYLIIEFRGGILEGKQEDFSSVLSVHGKQRGRESSMWFCKESRTAWSHVFFLLICILYYCLCSPLSVVV